MIQKEFTGTESKSETEKLLRQAMEDYEEKKFIAKADDKLKTVTAEHLQTFLDLLTFGGTYPDGTVKL